MLFMYVYERCILGWMFYHSLSGIDPYNYRPPTKLLKGNVFDRVCLFGGVHYYWCYCSVTCHLGTPDLLTHIHLGRPPPRPGPISSWNLFKLVRLRISTLDLFKLVYYVVHKSIGKRAVGFWLKGLLFVYPFGYLLPMNYGLVRL